MKKNGQHVFTVCLNIGGACPRQQETTIMFFLDFPVTERATNIDAEVNEKTHILYKTYKTTLAKWMPGYVGAENAEEFLKRFGTKSGRAGGATAAINAGVPREDV